MHIIQCKKRVDYCMQILPSLSTTTFNPSNASLISSFLVLFLGCDVIFFTTFFLTSFNNTEFFATTAGMANKMLSPRSSLSSLSLQTVSFFFFFGFSSSSSLSLDEEEEDDDEEDSSCFLFLSFFLSADGAFFLSWISAMI
ncbi:hypothetical protein BC943DRAFT_324919, partial [Umbelopsis sp. AD052]